MPEMRDFDLDDAFQNTNFVPDPTFKQRLQAHLMHPPGASINLPAPSPNRRHRRLLIPIDDSEDIGREASCSTTGFVPAFAGLIMILLVAVLGVSVLLPGGMAGDSQAVISSKTPPLSPPAQEPTQEPEPESDVVLAASPEDIAGMWTRAMEGSATSYYFKDDGTFHLLLSTDPEKLENSPGVIGEYWFEDSKLYLRDVEQFQAVTVGNCPDVGVYEVILLESGNLLFRTVDDECASRVDNLVGPGFFDIEYTILPEPTSVPSSAPTSTPNTSSGEIEVPYEDRVIRGTLMGDGDLAVIVAPGYLESRAHFMPLSEHIASLGYTVAAIDFPGFGGASTGEASYSKGQDDVLAVMEVLNERGYERIVCIGGSLGGPSCLNAALQRTDMAGLVIITAYIQVTPEDAATLTMPKLLIMGSQPDNVTIMRELFSVLPAPKELMTVTAAAQSSELLRSADAGEIFEAIAAFLDGLR